MLLFSNVQGCIHEVHQGIELDLRGDFTCPQNIYIFPPVMMSVFIEIVSTLRKAVLSLSTVFKTTNQPERT